MVDAFIEMPVPDLTLRGYGCEVHYMETSTPGAVSYALFGMTLNGICPDCGSEDMKDKGGYDKCMGCGVRLTMEYMESKIIASG